jgi:hypothetical protein
VRFPKPRPRRPRNEHRAVQAQAEGHAAGTGQDLIDGGTPPRLKSSPAIILEYGEAMLSGTVFPPLEVFFDGETHWLADGFHWFEVPARHHPRNRLPYMNRGATNPGLSLRALKERRGCGLENATPGHARQPPAAPAGRFRLP